MTLRDQADLYLSSQGGSNLVNAGLACSTIADSIQQNDAIVTPLLANIFWQAFINSPAFDVVLRSAIRLGIDPFLLNAVLNQSRTTQLDMLIVRHGKGAWPLQDLLIFVHGADQKQAPVGIRDVWRIMQKENISSNVLIGGWRRFIRTQQGLGQVIIDEGGAAAVEILQMQDFHILIAPLPRREYTSAFASSPALEVTTENGWHMTVGVYADSFYVYRRKGITTALHAIEEDKSQYIALSGKLLYVDQHDKSPSTDSCFVEIPPDPNLRQNFRQPLKPLVGVAPPVGAVMSFERVDQGKQSTTITAVDHLIPWAFANPTSTPIQQARVYTDPVTIPGDSGAALINDSGDIVVGFCSFRFTGAFAAAVWIWAESVFIAHRLR